ncbi:alpha-L-rhamnosidase (RhaA is able to hydrolyze alpha-1) [Phlyctema vagabunda]|uniref:Alpha-L-rhamnosidase (RhaA is able to hydrolyze alpha-1) n=1 Tax=Phlyctema vagabunda TaxID=108571 RepID=A0ABR4PVC3_9HELO
MSHVNTDDFLFGYSQPTKIIERSGKRIEEWHNTSWSLATGVVGYASIIVDYGRAEGGIPFFKTSIVESQSEVVEVECIYSETFEGIHEDGGDGPFFLFSNAMNTYRTKTHKFNRSNIPSYIEDHFAQRSQRYQKIILKTPNSSIHFSAIGYRHIRQPNSIKNSFSCSNQQLNRIWQDGVRTVDMCTVEAGETAEAWEVTEEGTIVRGQHWAPCRHGTRWADKTVEFEVEIKNGGASWGIHMVANGLVFCLDVNKRSLAAFEGLADTSGVFPSIPRGTWSFDPSIDLEGWIKIESIAEGSSVSVKVNGQSLASISDLSIHPVLGGSGNNTGSVAFGGPAHYTAVYRSLVVKNRQGHILYENDLLLSNKDRILADFQVGSNPLACTIDGAKRDRACFGGDLFVMGRSIYYSTGNFDAVLGSIKLLTSHQTSDGYLGNLCSIQAPMHDDDESEPPTYAFYSLSYALLLIVAIKDYWIFSGDTVILNSVWERLERLIAYTDRFSDDRGLIMAPPPLSMDWFPMGGPIFGASGKINLAFYDALRSMSKMATSTENSKKFEKRAERVRQSIVNHLWNDQTGSMRLSDITSSGGLCQDINAYGVITGVSPIHPQTISLLTAPPGSALPLAFSEIEKWDQKKVVSPYASGYAAEALFTRDEGRSAVELIERVWGTMADPTNPNYSGGHWEAMKPDGTPITNDTSLMHGWSTWPVHLLPRYLGGLAPLQAGWSRFQVKPVLAGLSSVDVQLTTPAGSISVSISACEMKGTGGIKISVPSGTVAEVFAPKAWMIVRPDGSSCLKTEYDPLKAHRCGICGKDFTRSDLLKRHVAGHERWDKKDVPSSQIHVTRSTKRRKIASGDEALLEPSSSSRLSRIDSSSQEHYDNRPDRLEDSPNQSLSTREANGAKSDHTGSFEAASLQNSQTGFMGEMEFNGQEALVDRSDDGSNPVVLGNPMTVFHDTGPIHQPPRFQEIDQPATATDSFGFSSYLLPSDDAVMAAEWFSTEFYSAMRETDYEWDTTGQILDPNILLSWQNDDSPAVEAEDQSANYHLEMPLATSHRYEEAPCIASRDYVASGDQGRVSRIHSPPNEASEEDKWPFQWNPNSQPILHSKNIEIPPDHVLFAKHNSKFDISESTFLKMRAFLNPPVGREFHQSQKGRVTLPSLAVVNLFIGLFFEYFSPQAPVLHHATVNTNTDLPPPLLIAIVVIGAIYSHQRHTRRFAIVLLDILRWHLQIAMECNNSLMQDHLIIYTEVLICQAALWCGNKRAFVMAEALRGTTITHVRRAGLLRTTKKAYSATDVNAGSVKERMQSQWKSWISEESRRRLYWVIYTLDSQFPSLLNLPATMSIGEIIDLGCPCDEEFWLASSARNWKNLLGPAQFPPSREFSAAAGPFLLATSYSASLQHTHAKQERQDRDQRLEDRLPILDLNPWSAFLVMMTIQNEAFKYAQDHLLARKFMDDDEYPDGISSNDTLNEHEESGVDILKAQRIAHRDQISKSLEIWSKAYIDAPARSTSNPTSKHFHSAAVVLYHLATILLDVSLTDLQNAIGKDGSSGISQAMINLNKWAAEAPRKAAIVAYNAVKTIVSLTSKQSRFDDDAHLTGTIPYNLITIFLCHVVLWAFVSASNDSQKSQLLQILCTDQEVCSSSFFSTLKRGLSSQDRDPEIVDSLTISEFQRFIFKSAAEMLAQFATWGAALNLALLLHNRAEM